jgi:superfamily II RNA helicase
MKILNDTITMEQCAPEVIDILTKTYSFTPDSFQLHACDAIQRDENVLVTAHTGSGKTLIAEYTIMSKIAKGKKVIYTSPIKSLSNQKYYELSLKFPDIRFGVVTGDIKFSPDADVLIMTTEILRNLLYKKPVMLDKQDELKVNMSDVGAVIFDEVHYINDKERGKVWEECMILMPNDVTMVMLSATIRSPEKLGQWLDMIKPSNLNLISNERRVVPLTHYVYHSVLPSSQKKEKVYNQIKQYDDTLVEIMDHKNNINGAEIDRVVNVYNKYRDHFQTMDLMNQLVKHLHTNELLPALTFVLSRKKCEKYAKFISHSLLTTQEIAEQKKKTRFYLSKLDHKDTVEELHQYRMLSRCLEKGIAFHHGGMVPALKELVELLYADGLIKLLFATETFSVGINMPTRTVVFSGITKYDTGCGFRHLKPHEYIQMAGRAGRRGKDDKGYVIHLPTIYHNITPVSFKSSLSITPQLIESKFNYHYGLILQAYKDKTIDLSVLSGMSLAYAEIKEKLEAVQSKWDGVDYTQYNICFEVENLNSKFITVGGVKHFKERKQQAKDKKRKIEMISECENFHELWQYYQDNKQKIVDQLELYKENVYYSNLLQNNCAAKIHFLQKIGYLDEKYNVTETGDIATCFSEINPIVGTTIVKNDFWKDMNDKTLISLISSIGEVKHEIDGKYNPEFNDFFSEIQTYDMLEQRLRISPLSDWKTNIVLGPLIFSILSKQSSLSEISFETGIEEGTLLKYIWKFENVCNEFIQAARKVGNDTIMKKLHTYILRISSLYSASDSIYIKLVHYKSRANQQRTCQSPVCSQEMQPQQSCEPSQPEENQVLE